MPRCVPLHASAQALFTTGASVGKRWPCRRVLAERQDRELVQVLREKGLLGFHRLSRAETQRVADALKESGLPATLDQAICYRNYIKANNDMANRGKIHAFIRGEHGCVLSTRPTCPCALRNPPAFGSLTLPAWLGLIVVRLVTVVLRWCAGTSGEEAISSAYRKPSRYIQTSREPLESRMQT